MIVVIGDSLTAGQHLTEGGVPWPQLLVDHEVMAFGVPGDTTRLGLERFPRDVQNHEPEAVIIQFGHNDANRWESDRGAQRVSEAAFRANLAEMVQRARLFGAVVFLCTLTPSRRSRQHAEDTGRYDAIVREVAEFSSARLIDVRAAFGDLPAWLLLEDGLHLSFAGHRVYATVVQAALDEWRARQ